MVYGHVQGVLDIDARVRAATKVVHFEELCAAPVETIRTVLNHCALPDEERVVAQFAPSIRAPDYYPCPLSAAELELIRELTIATASALQGMR
jgi:hypothetical protein